ncbi:MAG: HEAT repeat domain-containing protein [Kofleriaceae bacterium]
MTARSFTLTPAEHQRIERIDQLAVLGGDSVHELLEALEDSSWTVRRAAVAALAALGDEAVPALQQWLTERRTSEHAIAAAVDAFATSIGESANAAAIEMLAVARPVVAADATAILGRRHALEATPQLVAQLAHRDDNVAVASIEALGALGPPATAIDPLIDVLEQRSFFRAFPALQVLAGSGDPRAVQPIAAVLADPIFGVEAIRALGRTGLATAIAPLTRLLADPALVTTVALAFAELIHRADWGGGADHITQTLHAALAPALTDLIAALPAADVAERAAIITVLGRTGSPVAMPVLVGRLEDDEVRAVATDAIKALTRTHEVALLAALNGSDPTVIAAVLPLVTSSNDALHVRALLDDGEAEVRARACEALARLGDTTAVPALFEALGDSNPRVALAATGAIQALHTGETAARALAALASGTPAVRRQVLRIIAYLGLAEAFEPVRAATADPDRRIAELAISALGTMPDPRVDDVLAELARSPQPTLRATAMRAWSHRESAATGPALEAGLADDDAWVRYYASQGLGRLGRTAATPLLLARLADAMPHVRVAAIEALARFETPAAAWQALTSAVRSTDPDERRAALVGLGQRRRAAAVPILVDAARSTDLATRLIAISGLAVQGGAEALEVLGRAARDADPALRDAALSLLGERDEPEAVRALIDIALDAAPSDAVHLALSRSSPARIAAIAAELDDANDHSATVLAAALARMADAGATSALFDALKTGNPSVRRAAASSLVAMSVAGARAAVTKLAADDPDLEVRRFCVALGSS